MTAIFTTAGVHNWTDFLFLGPLQRDDDDPHDMFIERYVRPLFADCDPPKEPGFFARYGNG